MTENENKTNPKHGGGKKKSTNCHVYIEPGVKIDLVDDLKQQQKTSEANNTAHQNKQIFWTKVAAGLLLLTAGFSGWQVKIAHDTFNAANRPYVGTAGVLKSYVQIVDGKEQFTDSPTPETTKMNINAEVKNFGPVPASDFWLKWKIFLNDKEMSVKPNPDSPDTLYPGQMSRLVGSVWGDVYRSIANGTVVLRIEITIKYKGPSGTYYECTEHKYDPQYNSFWSLGECKPN